MQVLGGVYVDQSAVDDELVDIILKPAFTPNALDVFVSVITGQQAQLLSRYHVIALWGIDQGNHSSWSCHVHQHCCYDLQLWLTDQTA